MIMRPLNRPESSRLSRSERGRKREVYLINADGTNERKWLHSPHAFGMAWSPDGKWVAFSQRNAKQESNLFVLELRTGKQKNITAPVGED